MGHLSNARREAPTDLDAARVLPRLGDAWLLVTDADAMAEPGHRFTEAFFDALQAHRRMGDLCRSLGMMRDSRIRRSKLPGAAASWREVIGTTTAVIEACHRSRVRTCDPRVSIARALSEASAHVPALPPRELGPDEGR